MAMIGVGPGKLTGSCTLVHLPTAGKRLRGANTEEDQNRNDGAFLISQTKVAQRLWSQRNLDPTPALLCDFR